MTALRRPPGGFALLLTATIIGGLAGYVVTWLVPRQLGFAAYTVFAVFWAALFLVTGSLTGVQGEVARGTTMVQGPTHGRARNFAIVASLVLFAAVLITGPLWQSSVFGPDSGMLVIPLAVGAGSFVLTATASGVFLGIGRWGAFAALVIVEALLRLAAVAVAAALTDDLVVLAWAVVMPMPIALVAVWLVVRGRVVGGHDLDVGYRRLLANVSRTILASASSAVMVSGFPLILGLAASGVSKELLGLAILAITFTRAPLIISALSLQNYFVVLFRDASGVARRRVLLFVAALAAGTLILGALAWWLGPGVFAVLFPDEPTPVPWFLAAMVASSALVAGLFVSGAAVLARSAHGAYAVGWLVSAALTVAIVFLPLDFLVRTALALIVAPIAGLIIHAVGIARTTRRPPAG